MLKAVNQLVSTSNLWIKAWVTVYQYVNQTNPSGTPVTFNTSLQAWVDLHYISQYKLGIFNNFNDMLSIQRKPKIASRVAKYSIENRTQLSFQSKYQRKAWTSQKQEKTWGVGEAKTLFCQQLLFGPFASVSVEIWPVTFLLSVKWCVICAPFH